MHDRLPDRSTHTPAVGDPPSSTTRTHAATKTILDQDFLGGDLLDRGHKHVRDDGDAAEAPEEAYEVQCTSATSFGVNSAAPSLEVDRANPGEFDQI